MGKIRTYWCTRSSVQSSVLQCPKSTALIMTIVTDQEWNDGNIFTYRMSLYNPFLWFMPPCLPGLEQQKESSSRGHNAALPGQHCHLHGGTPHGLSQQPVDNHLQPVPDLPHKTALCASSEGRYQLVRVLSHGLMWLLSEENASSGALVWFKRTES